ncbi:hypothetical protein KUCAC02_006688, partial [Chaenocephalus aceratus]
PEMKLHKLFPHNLEFMRLVFLKEGPENADKSSSFSRMGAELPVEAHCVKGERKGRRRAKNTKCEV